METGKSPGGNPTGRAGTAPPEHAHGPAKGGERYGGDQNRVRRANFLLDRLRGFSTAASIKMSASRFCAKRIFCCCHIDGHNMHAQGSSVLNGEVAQTAHAGDGHPIRRSASEFVSGLCRW
jgi:hypothetical protein